MVFRKNTPESGQHYYSTKNRVNFSENYTFTQKYVWFYYITLLLIFQVYY